MTRPTTRENSSLAQFRRRVPADVASRARGGFFQVEVPATSAAPAATFATTAGIYLKFSLRTRDPSVATYRAAVANSQADRWFDALRSGPAGVSHKLLVTLSGEVYRLYLDRFVDDPGSADDWAALKAFNRAAREGRLLNDVPTLRPAGLDAAGAAVERFGADLTTGINALPMSADRAALETRFGLLASWVLQKHSLRVDDETRGRLLVQVEAALSDAAWALKRASLGDYSPDPRATRFPASGAVSLDDLFAKWEGETKPSASTLMTWRGVLRQLKGHVGEAKAGDIARIAPDDLVAWKDAAVARGLSAKTINATYLGMAKTLLGYAVRNRLLSSNPADGVRVSARARAGTSKLPYTDDEVARILALAKAETHPGRRWLPWLLASSGARVGELAQLWGRRVVEEEGVPVMKLAPAEDGGNVKNEGSERTVPIHPALIADGFLDFVRSKGDGPLFYRRSSGKAAKRHASKGVANHLGVWVREAGFDDPRKAPNHAFRHYFKSAAAKAGVADSTADAIQGHAATSEAGRYRHFGVPALATAVAAVPIPPARKEKSSD